MEEKKEESIKEFFERQLHLKEDDVLKTLEICEGDTQAAAIGLAALSMFRSQMHFRRRMMDEITKSMWQPPPMPDNVLFFLKEKWEKAKPGEIDADSSKP